MTTRIYPAYGRQIAYRIRRGQHPLAVGVMLSSFWSDFLDVPRLCLRPEDWALGRYEFSYLRGERVVLIVGHDDDTHAGGGRLVGELLCELMLARPSLVWVAHQAGGWIEQSGTPPALEALAVEMRVPRELASVARTVYAESFLAASQRDADRAIAALEAGRMPAPSGLAEVEQRFGNPFWVGDAQAA